MARFTWEEARRDLKYRRERALKLGGEQMLERQRSGGRQTIRERLDQLTDPGSFQEVGTLTTHKRRDVHGARLEPTSAGYVMGLGKIDGRPVAVGGEDFTVQGGSSSGGMTKAKGGMGGFVEDMAHEYRIPLLLLVEGAGGGLDKEESGPPQVGGSLTTSFKLLGEVPVLTAAMGACAGYAGGRVTISHFSVMTRDTACVFAGGPPLVTRALGYKINKFELGGAHIHTQESGLVDNVAEDEADALRQLKRVLSYLPQSVWDMPPFVDTGDPPDRQDDILLRIVPEDRRKAYDIHDVIDVVVDKDSFFEISPEWGQCLVTGLARIGGFPIGLLANNPMHIGGALDARGSQKQARFIEFCDTFHLPIVYLVDVPGFMIGEAAEREGTLRKGMRALQAMSEATVPMVTVHMRKGYGMAYDATSNPNRLQLRVMWPTTEWGSIPIEGGVAAAYRREIDAASDPDELRARLEQERLEEASPWELAEYFALDEMLDPTETRGFIYKFIDAAQGSIRSGLGPKPRYGVRV